MGSVTETRVSYHADHLETARPAINVKVHVGFDSFRATYEMIENVLGEDAAQQCLDIATETVRRQFWDEDLPRMAAILGFEVEQAGRSGGWVEITNVDPANLEDEALTTFLSNYRQFDEWCSREVAESTKRINAAAEEVAVEMKLASTLTVREIVSFDGEFKAGVIKLAQEMGFQPA